MTTHEYQWSARALNLSSGDDTTKAFLNNGNSDLSNYITQLSDGWQFKRNNDDYSIKIWSYLFYWYNPSNITSIQIKKSDIDVIQCDLDINSLSPANSFWISVYTHDGGIFPYAQGEKYSLFINKEHTSTTNEIIHNTGHFECNLNQFMSNNGDYMSTLGDDTRIHSIVLSTNSGPNNVSYDISIRSTNIHFKDSGHDVKVNGTPFDGNNIKTIFQPLIPPSLFSSSAAATGDPYITPIYGNLYKLPNRTAFYRLLKHNDTFINGEVLRFDEANINNNCALLNLQMDKFAPEDFNINSMYFFKNIYISHDGKETVYNLLDKTFTNDCFEHTFTQTKLETCKIYYYENMEACEIDLGGIQIKLCTFDNPQIISGIELKANEDLSNASGLLVHQQSSKPHMLKTIKSKKETYKVEKHGRVVKEHFVTKTNSGTETIIRDITVL